MNHNDHIPEAAKQRANEIYFSALEIESDDERNAFIEKACADDAAMRREVNALFELQDRAASIFHKHNPARISAVEIVNTLTKIPEFFGHMKPTLSDDDDIGKQIGPYKLLQKIGEGGVGNVYLAEQAKPVRRQVALKIIKVGMDTKSVIARFEAERQALAMMEHPNIAHVLNAGETDTGRPFFVMELVDGERITTYCNENGLTIRQRLELFTHVCHAIQHAHQKGIIHRDIKPSNVLITRHNGMPSPIVIDFGIAKATGGDLLTEKTLNTSMGPLIGTPAYMSPEQTNLTQTDIDTRSDIYSLGILLYELLISKPPFDHKDLLRVGLDEMCRILREREPPTLLTKFQAMDSEDQVTVAKQRGMDPRRLCASLTDDLAWITMKAMEKERERRYESAGELAMEIQRFLNNEPVTARPPSRLYRFRKLVRRNKTTFAYLTMVALVVILGFGTSTWLFFRERAVRKSEMRLRNEANARAKISQAALLLSHNKMVEADQLVESIGTSVVEPSLEAANVYRTLGEWNVGQRRWDHAAERFLRLASVNRPDRTYFIEQMNIDLISAASALAATGKAAAYRHFIDEYLARYADTEDPIDAAQIIKASLLIAANPATLQYLEPCKKTVEAFIADRIPGNRAEIDRIAWGTFSLALLDYRSGDAAKALRLGQNCLDYPPKNPTRTALTHLLLAMSYAKLEHPINARIELALGREALNGKLPNGLDGIVQMKNNKPSAWHDWVMVNLLLREAAELVEAPDDSAKSPAHRSAE